MVLGFCAQQSPCINLSVNFTRESNKLTGQNSVKRFNIGSNKAFIKTFTLSEASILLFILPFTKNLFIKFMNIFMEITQVQTQVLIEL